MSCCKPRYLGCFVSGNPVAGTTLTIPLNICGDELRQGDCFDFEIRCCFTYPECITNVLLSINNTVGLILLKDGAVKSDQIRNRRRYRVVVGTEFHTATVVTQLPCSKFPFDTIPLDLTTASVTTAAVPSAKAVKK